MGNANYIGRVGGLALALGVGMAVGAAPGAAWANPSDSANASVSAANTSPPPTATRGSGRAARSAPAPSSSASASGATSRSGMAAAASNSGQPHTGSALAPVPQAAAARTPVPATSAPAAPAAALSVNAGTPKGPAAAAVVVAAAPAAAPVHAAAAALSAALAATKPAPAPAAAVAVTKAAIANAGGLATWVQSVLAQLGSSLLGDQTALTSLSAVLALVRKEFAKIGSLHTPAAAVTNSSAVTSPNLLVNGGAEIGSPSPSGMAAVTIPGWTVTGTPTVIGYGTARTIWSVGTSSPMPNLPTSMGFPSTKVGPTVGGTFTGGSQFFAGGPVANSSISQTVDLSGAASQIATGTLSYNLGGWLGGYTLDPSAASVKVTFLDTSGKALGSASLKPVGLFARGFKTSFKQETATGVIPVGTTSAQVVVTFTDKNPIKYGFNADYNDAFADNISFTVGADLPAPPAPTPPAVNPTMVGSLDHVFMTYVENKGSTNIVGSKNAPYINSLINGANTSGTGTGIADYLSNYYASTHGSLPNYYPINGGTNYGITYNCATVCINDSSPTVKTLVKSLAASGKSWMDYADGMTPGQDPTVSSGNYAFDSAPFQAFQTIGGNKAYATQHIVPLPQMATDLKSNATTPALVWFAPDENTNGEGPVSGLSGKIKFALNQLDPNHQYNVAALDQFVQQNVTTITSSAVWNDPTQKSAIFVTFDEDNDNLNYGFGNQGNHVVTVVIPSPGAIAAGMKVGFTSTQYSTQYGLLRTVEEALGLTGQYGYLTSNDQYATPMNDLWGTQGPPSAAASVV